MLRGFQYFSILFTITMLGKLNCQICNLGKNHREETNISTVYQFDSSKDHERLTADKAFNGRYSIHHTDCAGSANEQDPPAWWRVTFKSISKIFKINLIFRELYDRHAGYYVYITNQTVTVDELSGHDPVYHDVEVRPSLQNTIVFPGGHYGLQMYLYVNKTSYYGGGAFGAFIEPCEVEILGCATNVTGCNCSDPSMDNQELVLWDSRVAFGEWSVTLRCDRYYLSIMNLTGQNEAELVSILEACDGKQQCTIPTSQDLKNKSISFYCTNRCVNEAFNNTIPVAQLMENSDVGYHTNVNTNLTAFLKSQEFRCSMRHVLTSGNLTLQCQLGGRWIREAPVCNVTCQEPIHENITTIRQTDPFPHYFADYSVSYTCRKNHRQVEGNLTRVCNKSGDWTGNQPVCKRCKCPCDRLTSQNFITDPQVLQDRINEIEKKLKINTKELSATVRKKICAKDERKSSKGIGSVLGIGIIVFVVSIIVCSDIPTLYGHTRYGP